MSSAAQKTPISLLQELCVQQGITADYKLMSVEGAVHAPTFMYRVQVGETVATATGASKKKAKHAAAKAVLEKLLTEAGGYAEGFVSDGVVVNAQTLQEVIASSSSEPSEAPQSEDVQGNPVGALQELCMRRHWQPPHYKTENESGLPHERTFTIACEVECFSELGTGKSKRLAKRQAADKMLKKLESLKPNTENEDNDIVNELNISDLSIKHKGFRKSTVQSLYYERVQDFLNDLKTSTNPCLLALQEVDLTDENLNCTMLLQSIAMEQSFDVNYLPIEQPGKSGKYHCLVQLNSLPVAVCFGMGNTRDEARSNCARNALNFIQLMCKPM